MLLISVDIPDPYVTVTIKTSPHGVQRTQHKDNDINPVWDETFKFYLNPAVENEMGRYFVKVRLAFSPTVLPHLVQ